MSTIWHRLVFAIIIVLAGCAEDQSEPRQKFPHETSRYDLQPADGVRFGRLDNGMRYAVQHNAKPEQAISLRLMVDVGSMDERDGEEGLAHLLEHLVFKAAPGRDESALKVMERFGVRSGQHSNAYTSYEETLYRFDIPKNDAETLDAAFTILRDIASRALIDADLLAAELEIVLRELSARNSPGLRLRKARYDYLAADSLVGKRSPIGVEASLKAFDVDKLLAFYKRFYRPDRMTIIAVGDLPDDQLVDLVHSYFADFKNPSEPSPDAPERDEIPLPEVVSASYIEAGLTPRLEIYGRKPAAKKQDSTEDTADSISEADDISDTGENTDAPKDVPKDVPEETSEEASEDAPKSAPKSDHLEKLRKEMVRTFAANALNSRFSQLLWEPEPSFNGAYEGSFSVLNGPSYRDVTITLKDNDAALAAKTAARELQRVIQHGFTAAELDEQIRNRERYLQSLVDGYDKRYSAQIANSLHQSIRDGWVYRHPDIYQQEFAAIVDQLTTEDMADVVRKRWQGVDMRFLLTGPAELDISGEQLAQIWQENMQADVKPWNRERATSFAHTDFGAPGEIVSRTDYPDLDVTQLVFANNVRVNMKVTAHEKNKLYVNMQLGAGTSSTADDPQGFWAKALYSLLLGGFEAHAFQDLRPILAGSGITLNPNFDSDGLGLSGTAPTDKQQVFLHLLTAVLANPGYRSEGVQLIDRSFEQNYKNIPASPSQLLTIYGQHHFFGDDPGLAVYPTNVEAIKAVDMAVIKKRMAPLLRDEYLEIAIVGDFDKAVMEKQLAQTFGALPARAEKPIIMRPRDGIAFQNIGETLTINHSANDQRSIVKSYFGYPPAEISVRDSLAMQIYGSIISSRMFDQIREEIGAAYTPSAAFTYDRDYNYAYLTAQSDTLPDKITAVQQMIRQVIQSLPGNITEDEFARAVKPLTDNQNAQMQSNSYWLGRLSLSQFHADKLDVARDIFDVLATITPADVDEVAETMADIAPATIIVQPEPAAPAGAASD